MLCAECVFPDPDRLAIVALRLQILALEAAGLGQIVERHGGQRMARGQIALRQFDGSPGVLFGPRVIAETQCRRGQVAVGGHRIHAVGAFHRVAQQFFRIGIAMLREVDRRQNQPVGRTVRRARGWKIVKRGLGAQGERFGLLQLAAGPVERRQIAHRACRRQARGTRSTPRAWAALPDEAFRSPS